MADNEMGAAAGGAGANATQTMEERLDAMVEGWFHEAFQNSVVARTTEVWNHVHAAKDELKRRLAAFLAEHV